MLTKEELLARFGADHFAVGLGMEIDEITPTGAVCSLVLQNRHKNSLGAAQGGAIFTLADFVFAAAAASRHFGTVSLNGDIHFLSSPTKGRLTATATMRSDGGRICVYDVVIVDDAGNDVATATMTGYKKQPPPQKQ